MEHPWNIASVDKLLDAILTREADIPSFALLLGSGTSITSRVDSAYEMIDKWRRELHRRSGTSKSYDRWLKEHEWYDTDDEYAVLFEVMYDHPSLRRAQVERQLEKAHPTWGYVYLANLLKHNIFNIVFTTNFDDLINEACCLYSDGLHPLVCAHDSAVSGIRVTTKRPKIIKLHGDFLFDNIKNTVRELDTLEENMKRKLMQFAQEYGLVVVGYSGRDRSVMDILDMLVQRDEYFKQGIYWCELAGEEKRTRRLSSLLRRDKVRLVKVSGFDELLAEIHDRAGLSLPRLVTDPLWGIYDRSRLFVDVPPSLKRSGIISKDIQTVLQHVSDIMQWLKCPASQASLQSVENVYLATACPSSLRAAALKQQRDLESALKEIRNAYQEKPDRAIAYEMADVLARLHRKEELREFILDEHCLVSDENKTYFLLHADDNQGAIAMADMVLSSQSGSHIARINRAIALKRLGDVKGMKKELLIIERESPSLEMNAAIAALRGEKNEMLSLLETALSRGVLTVGHIETFVVFEDYWQDDDLLSLLDKWRVPGYVLRQNKLLPNRDRCVISRGYRNIMSFSPPLLLDGTFC